MDTKETSNQLSTYKLDSKFVSVEGPIQQNRYDTLHRGILFTADSKLTSGANDRTTSQNDRRRGSVIFHGIRKRIFKEPSSPAQQKIDVSVRCWSFSAETDSSTLEKRVIREVLIRVRLRHPHIEPLLGYHIDLPRKQAYLVVSLERSSSLSEYIAHHNPPMNLRWNFLANVAEALEYLHELDPSVVHGEVRAANFLLSADLHVRISNFGLSTNLGCEEMLSPTEVGMATNSSAQWCPPEFFTDPELPGAPASDVWMWAMSSYEIITGKVPYHNISKRSEIIQQILQGQDPTANEGDAIPSKLLELLRQCWAAEPQKRPLARQIVQRIASLRAVRRDSLMAAATQEPSATSQTVTLMGSTSTSNADEVNRTASYVGGPRGWPWSDIASFDEEQQNEISAIHVYYDEIIHELRVQYRTAGGLRWANPHGCSAGPWPLKKYLFELEPEEYITEVSGRASTLVNALQFETNRGRQSVWCGKHRPGSPFTFTGPKLLYFTGRAGDQLDGIQPHWGESEDFGTVKESPATNSQRTPSTEDKTTAPPSFQIL